MNKLTTAERVQIIRCLVEGNSVRSTCRITGRSIHTVLNLLCDMGTACQKFHDERVRGLSSKRLQVDEVWNFCHCKQKNVPAEKKGRLGYGDCWTWTAVDADSKLIVGYLVGLRDGSYADEFIQDVADRLLHRVQLTSDGYHSYLQAVDGAFDAGVDYAQLIKVYGASQEETRYSPAECIGIEYRPVFGSPDPAHISTSFVERSNLTIRMSMRRFTRLTNGFSKKIDNMRHAIALNFAFYNFCRIHQTIRVTPAMEAGLTDHAWEIEELVALLG